MTEAEFIVRQNEVFGLFQQGKMDAVHALIDKVQIEFPDKIDKTIFWKACAFSVQNNSESAIHAFEEGLRKGVWWNPNILIRDPDLHSLQELEDFQTIVRKCEERFISSGEDSQSQFFTYGNHFADVGIFSLHMRGSSVNDFYPYWLSDDCGKPNNYFFGFPQSSQVFGYRAYCWDNQETAVEEINKTYLEFKRKGNTQQDILAGASQGGKLAIELCLRESKIDVKGFIAVIPAVKDLTEMENLLKGNKKANIKGYIITGNQDPFYEKVLVLVSLFRRYHVQCELIVLNGLGHFIPNDLAGLLPEAVAYVLQSE